MRILLRGVIFLLVCLVGISAQAKNPWVFDHWVLYDSFNSEFMDIEKWTTSERRDQGVMILESVRELHGGRLHMMGRTFGRIVEIPNTPPVPLGTAAGDVNSSFGFEKVFESLKVSVKVNDVEVTGCPDINTSASSSRARLAAFFFNAGVITPLPDPPGRTNDVLVQIRIQRSSNSTDKPRLLEVWADVGRCADPGCFGGPGSLISLGKIMLGQWATIEVDWNGDRQFNLRLNKEPTIVFDIPSEWGVYPVSSPGNTLGVANRIASCPADQRAVGFIDAEFENLFVKELPDL
jgi:hypothetical protein